MVPLPTAGDHAPFQLPMITAGKHRKFSGHHGWKFLQTGTFRRTLCVMSHALPLVIERDEDGTYVVECPVLPGCYTQGTTLDEALRNIHEVITLIRDEPDVQAILEDYAPREISFHTVTV